MTAPTAVDVPAPNRGFRMQVLLSAAAAYVALWALVAWLQLRAAGSLDALRHSPWRLVLLGILALVALRLWLDSRSRVHVIVTERGVVQPIRGDLRVITWPDVRSVQVHGAFLRVRGAGHRIDVDPRTFEDRQALATFIESHLPNGVPMPDLPASPRRE